MSATAAKTSGRPNAPALPNPAPAGRNSLRVVKEPKLQTLIVECCVRPEMTDEAVTERVIARLREMGDDAWPLIRVAIAARVNTDRRAGLRTTQRRLQRQMREFTPGDGTAPATDYVRRLTLDQLRELRGKSIKVPGREEPRAAESVTVSEWSLLAAALHKLAADASGRAGFYESIVCTLQGLGVDTISGALTPERRRK
jgi:hypothetical protein